MYTRCSNSARKSVSRKHGKCLCRGVACARLGRAGAVSAAEPSVSESVPASICVGAAESPDGGRCCCRPRPRPPRPLRPRPRARAHRLSPLLRERHGRPNPALTSLLVSFGEWDGSSALRLPRARSVPLPRPLRNKGAMLLENSRPNSGPPRPMLRRRQGDLAAGGSGSHQALQSLLWSGGGTGGHLLGNGLLQLRERGQRPVCQRLPARPEPR